MKLALLILAVALVPPLLPAALFWPAYLVLMLAVLSELMREPRRRRRRHAFDQ